MEERSLDVATLIAKPDELSITCACNRDKSLDLATLIAQPDDFWSLTRNLKVLSLPITIAPYLAEYNVWPDVSFPVHSFSLFNATVTQPVSLNELRLHLCDHTPSQYSTYDAESMAFRLSALAPALKQLVQPDCHVVFGFQEPGVNASKHTAEFMTDWTSRMLKREMEDSGPAHEVRSAASLLKRGWGNGWKRIYPGQVDCWPVHPSP
jgi:hypothetical protein